MNTGLTAEFFFLNLFCAIVFIFYGKVISSAKTNYQYYLRASFPIITYAFVHGLRFGRAIDWNVYYHIYTELGRGISNKHYEFLFTIICRSFYWLGIPYHFFIFIECFFLMTCVFILLKNFKKYIPFVLPLLLPAISGNDLLIRWFWGFSFFLLSINSLIQEKRLWMGIWGLCAIGCHMGYLFFIPLYLVYKVLNKVVFPPVVAVFLLYMTSFYVGLSSITIITTVTDLLLQLGVGGYDPKMEGYMLASQDLINGEWGQVGYMDRSVRSLLRLAIAYTPVLLFAYSYVEKIRYGKLLYNMFAVGVIVYPLFCVEILNRYAICLAFFSCIVCGAFYYETLGKRVLWGKMSVLFAICFFFALWPSISSSWKYGDEPLCGNNQMFIWDAKGRKAMF